MRPCCFDYATDALTEFRRRQLAAQPVPPLIGTTEVYFTEALAANRAARDASETNRSRMSNALFGACERDMRSAPAPAREY